MKGFETLEIVIGLVFVYLLFSTLVTLLVEYVSTLMRLRASNLKRIVARALDDDNLGKTSTVFYEHPLIKYLAESDNKKPSYISSDKFAKVVLDIIRTGGSIDGLGQSSTLNDNRPISDAIKDVGGNDLGPKTRALLVSFAKEAGEDINEFGKRLETWFNETAERGQGWFNRKIKLVTLIVSFLVAVACNVDTIRIYKQLSSNSALRTELADNAGKILKNDSLRLAMQNEGAKVVLHNDTISADTAYQIARTNLIGYYSNQLKSNTNTLAIGWDKTGCEYFKGGCNWFFVMLGWIMTAFAISLGAPFWFGILNKLLALRAAGKGMASEEEAKRNKEQISKPKPVG